MVVQRLRAITEERKRLMAALHSFVLQVIAFSTCCFNMLAMRRRVLSLYLATGGHGHIAARLRAASPPSAHGISQHSDV